MSNVQPLVIREENGETYTIYVAVKDESADIPTPSLDDRESYGIDSQAILVEMVQVHQAIRAYTDYAIGAFKNFSTEYIEEVNLKFGLKIGGKTGIPFLAEATSEGNFEIEVKCKFPHKQIE
jgi:hypothetical protein